MAVDTRPTFKELNKDAFAELAGLGGPVLLPKFPYRPEYIAAYEQLTGETFRP